MQYKTKLNCNKRSPKVSVCMTSYNHGKYIGDAIHSVLQQSFSDFEFLILENGSTDNSIDIIKSFHDDRIKIIIFNKNLHSTYAANEIMKQCTGEYVAFLCSDDSWDKNKLLKQVEFLDDHIDIATVFSRINVIDENSNKYVYETPYDYYFNCHHNRSRFEWLENLFDFQLNPFCCSSALLRKHIWNECGPFDVRLRNMQDLTLWVTILHKYEVHILDDKLTNMRYFVKNTNITGNTLKHHVIISNEARLFFEVFFNKVTSIFDFKKIFGNNVLNYKKLYREDIKFYLLMMGINATRVDLKAYSINTLYDLMGDEMVRKRFYQRYNFTHLDLYFLSEECDIYSHRFMFTEFNQNNDFKTLPSYEFLEKFVVLLKKIKMFSVARYLFYKILYPIVR